MTKQLQQDVLYSFIKRSVRNALDLEYAIRASELVSPDQTASLRVLDTKLVDFWKGLGANQEEIRDSKLRDFAWDALQVGFLMTRRHTTGVHPEIVELANRGLSTVREEFAADLHLLTIPAARFFRVCDLLSGNDIPRLILTVNDRLAAAAKYRRESDVPLNEFRMDVREPIHIHPRFGYRERTHQTGVETVFSFEVDLTGDFSLFEWRRQMNEFQYQYALYRAARSGVHDDVTRALIQDFLEQEHRGSQSEFDVPRLDSFLPALTGIYCWDRCNRDGVSQVSAFDEAMRFYDAGGKSKPVTHENLKLNYMRACERIEGFVQRFRRATEFAPGSDLTLASHSPTSPEEQQRFEEWSARFEEEMAQLRAQGGGDTPSK